MIRTIDDTTQEPGGDPLAERLRAAAPLKPTGVSYGAVQRRAGSLRRRRRAVQAAGMAAVIAAGVVVATTLPLPGVLKDRAEVAVVPGIVTRLCDGNVQPHDGTIADVPDLLYLPAQGVSAPPDGISVSTLRGPCDAPLPVAALGYRVENGRTTEGAVISGPVDSSVTEEKLKPAEAVSVPVPTGTLSLRILEGDDPGKRLNREGWWVDDAGHAWWIEAVATTTELADLVGGLRVEQGRIDLDSLPPSMTTVLGPQDVPFHRTEGWSYSASWDRSDPQLSFYSVNEGGSVARILATSLNARPITLTVDGARRAAVWQEGQFGGLSCELGNGRVLSISGVDRELAEQLAESTGRVTADDPRMAAGR
jgi:hypothetical protein